MVEKLLLIDTSGRAFSFDRENENVQYVWEKKKPKIDTKNRKS